MLNRMDNIEEYRQHFMDADLWEPHVREVCRRHSLPCGQVLAGLKGTYPTFIVDRRYVVKFFGRLFEGDHSFRVEYEANQVIRGFPSFYTPKLLEASSLYDSGSEGRWPYLVFEYLLGSSIGKVFKIIPGDQMDQIARELGNGVRKLHSFPITGSAIFPDGWNAWIEFIKGQKSDCAANQREWGSLPEHLLTQIEKYLLPVEALVDFAEPAHLIHADLTGDHLLCVEDMGSWKMTGIIDWGDAMTGNILYELAALHIGMFRCNGRYLRAFLKAYDLPVFYRAGFARKAMSVSLMHRFDVIGSVFMCIPEAKECASLEELGELVWGRAF